MNRIRPCEAIPEPSLLGPRIDQCGLQGSMPHQHLNLGRGEPEYAGVDVYGEIVKHVYPICMAKRMKLPVLRIGRWRDAGARLARDSAAVDFVAFAFAHLKAIAHDEGAAPLLAKANAEADAGIVAASDVRGFLAAAAVRQWDREPKLRQPAPEARRLSSHEAQLYAPRRGQLDEHGRVMQQARPASEDEQLEIPAFLRRQAN